MQLKSILLASALQAALTVAVDVDINVDSSRVSQFLHSHPPGNRTHNGHSHDHVDVDIDHQHRGNNTHSGVDVEHHPPHHGPNETNTNPYGGNNMQTRDGGMGNAIIGNRCPYDIWIWSVDQTGSSEAIKVPSRTKYSEPFRSPCDGCGVSFKVSTTDQLQGGKQTQFEYAIAGGQVWYDISFVDCAQGEGAESCPGHEKGLAMDSPEGACGRINCGGGSYCPTQAYYVDTPLQKLGIPEPVFGCGTAGTGMDLFMKVCSDETPLKRSIAGRVVVDDEI